MTYNQGSAENQTDDSTTVAFNYDSATTKSIDIFGTTAIPEFPTTTIALAMSTVAGIVVSSLVFQRVRFNA
jgi:hypothetical protein